MLASGRPMEDAAVRFVDIRHHLEGAHIAWRLLQERPPEANISHHRMPTLEEHLQFVAQHPYRAWYVIETDVIPGPLPHRQPVGTINATSQNEIGIAILRSHQRQGWARRAINEMVSFLPPLPGIPGMRSGRWTANVAPENKASLALFEALGCRRIQVTFRLPERGAEHGQTKTPTET